MRVEGDLRGLKDNLGKQAGSHVLLMSSLKSTKE